MAEGRRKHIFSRNSIQVGGFLSTYITWSISYCRFYPGFSRSQVAISKSARKNLRDFCRMSGDFRFLGAVGITGFDQVMLRMKSCLVCGCSRVAESWSKGLEPRSHLADAEPDLVASNYAPILAWQRTFYEKDEKTCPRSIEYRTWGILQFTEWTSINNKWSSSIAGVK